MKTVVVTGGTRGIGFGLAKEFLRRGHSVAVSGRSQAACDEAVSALQTGNGKILGVRCDVRELVQIQQLWRRAKDDFGVVDIWINNAGRSHGTHRFWDQPAETAAAVVGTNLIGLMQACHVVVAGMIEQGHGAIYNLSGFGRNGMQRSGMSIYGTSKRGVDYFTKALAREVADTGILVCQMNPGMIITDMLREGYTTSVQSPESVQRFYNIMADMPDDAAPFLIDKILANRKNGVLINRQPRYRVMARLLGSVFRRPRNVFRP